MIFKKFRQWRYAGSIFSLTALPIYKILAQRGGAAPGERGGAVGGETFPLPNPLGTRSYLDIINDIINFLIYVSVPLLALMILWGGFQILGARGDVEKVKNGRATIQWSVIGFTIILISKGVALVLLRILYPSTP